MKRMDERKLQTIALLGAALLAAGCGGDAQAGDAQAEGGDAPEEEVFQRVINVAVEAATPAPFRELIRITGTVSADQEVLVSAEESGVVRELLVARGAAVRAGAPLARIDATVLQAQVNEAEARAALARETWTRRKRLFEEDRIGSELAYLEARYGSEQAEAALASLRERLARTVVRAPIGGIVDERAVEVGTMVAPGSEVARIIRIDPIKVTAGIPERYAGDVRVGQPAHVTFDILSGERFEGRISFVGSKVNPRNRTFEIEIVIRNPGQVIKPEMVANVEVSRREVENAIVLPQDAAVRVENGFVVFVAETVDGVDVARVRPIDIAISQRNQVVVREGLEAGDRVIVVGQKQVADGDRIQITRSGGER